MDKDKKQRVFQLVLVVLRPALLSALGAFGMYLATDFPSVYSAMCN